MVVAPTHLAVRDDPQPLTRLRFRIGETKPINAVSRVPLVLNGTTRMPDHILQGRFFESNPVLA
jgi:hypothetical protein